jgi:hypothetical protein
MLDSTPFARFPYVLFSAYLGAGSSWAGMLVSSRLIVSAGM